MLRSSLRASDTWVSPTTQTRDRPVSLTHHAVGQCPCCASRESSRWFENADLVLRRCTACGVVYQDPQPDLTALLGKSYDEEYFGSCRNCLPLQENSFAQRLRQMEASLRAGEGREGHRVLDVGSGIGAFLAAAKKRGWEPVGLEPSAYAVDFCARTLGVRVVRGTLDDNVVLSPPFDAIHMSHVLEHLQHPLQNLQRVWSLLRPDGLLVVEVPREGKWASQLLHLLSGWRGATRHPRPAFTIVHMCIFTPQSLRALLTRSGFIVDRLWVESNAESRERFTERFGDAPGLGKFLGRIALLTRADVKVGLGNIVAFARPAAQSRVT